MSEKIIVIGSANADLVIHSPKMPKLGETLTGSSFQINAGGKGLNQAAAVSKLGGKVTFLGAVGKDNNGDFLVDTLMQNGICFEGIRESDISTGIAMITVVDANNFIIINPGTNERLTPEVIDRCEKLITDSSYCILQLEIPPETVMRVCEIAKKHGTKTVLNPAPCRELPDALLKNVDILIPNEHEAEGLTGIYPDTEEACRQAVSFLREKGVEQVIITLGERGCVYSLGDEIMFRQAEKAKAVDTTCAGDCFIGALVARLSSGDTLSAAVDFASKAAAIAVSREGASKSIPFADEIE